MLEGNQPQEQGHYSRQDGRNCWTNAKFPTRSRMTTSYLIDDTWIVFVLMHTLYLFISSIVFHRPDFTGWICSWGRSAAAKTITTRNRCGNSDCTRAPLLFILSERSLTVLEFHQAHRAHVTIPKCAAVLLEGSLFGRSLSQGWLVIFQCFEVFFLQY